MKRSLIVISMLMLAIGFLGCDYFQRKLSNEIGAKIDKAAAWAVQQADCSLLVSGFVFRFGFHAVEDSRGRS